jgi:hypothetical protein
VHGEVLCHSRIAKLETGQCPRNDALITEPYPKTVDRQLHVPPAMRTAQRWRVTFLLTWLGENCQWGSCRKWKRSTRASTMTRGEHTSRPFFPLSATAGPSKGHFSIVDHWFLCRWQVHRGAPSPNFSKQRLNESRIHPHTTSHGRLRVQFQLASRAATLLKRARIRTVCSDTA